MASSTGANNHHNAAAKKPVAAESALTELSGKMIKLKSEDGQVLIVAVEVASMSIVIKQMLGDLGADDDIDEAEAVPVRVSSEVLRHIVEWCEHHRCDPPIAGDESEDDAYDRRYADIPEWDKQFLSERGYSLDNRDKFTGLMLAANYLDIKGLLDVTCKTVASWLRGHTTEEMRDILGVPSDFTPEEEAQARYENDWLEERERW